MWGGVTASLPWPIGVLCRSERCLFCVAKVDGLPLNNNHFQSRTQNGHPYPARQRAMLQPLQSGGRGKSGGVICPPFSAASHLFCNFQHQYVFIHQLRNVKKLSAVMADVCECVCNCVCVCVFHSWSGTSWKSGAEDGNRGRDEPGQSGSQL